MSLLLVTVSVALQLEVVTMDQAVSAALANHPEARVARGQVDIARARVRQARAPLLPELSASARYGYSVSDQWGEEASQGDSYSAGLSGGVLLWDFGRSRDRWRSAEASAEATTEAADSTIDSLVLQVRLAFIDAREARALIGVAQQTLANQEKNLADTQAFVSIGSRPEIDLVRLRTGVAEARAGLIRAENDYRQAKVRLAGAMGVNTIDFEVADGPLPAVAGETVLARDMVGAAVRARPELVAQRASIRAQALNLRASEKWLLPSLRLGADASYFGQEWAEPGWGASVGVSLSWNIFDGFASPATVTSERAALGIEQARLVGVEQALWQEVETARNSLASAEAQRVAVVQGIEAARELQRLAQERYAAGVGSSLELTDAELELTNAAAAEVRVDNDVAAARAQLLRALGRRNWQ